MADKLKYLNAEQLNRAFREAAATDHDYEVSRPSGRRTPQELLTELEAYRGRSPVVAPKTAKELLTELLTYREKTKPSDEMLRIWQEVKANSAKLEACVGPHDFQPPEGSKAFAVKYTCSRCGGHLNAIEVIWYKRGLRDGARQEQDSAD